MRLDKYLCDMGAGTRSEVKKRIACGAVSVNGAVCRNAGQHVTEGKDRVEADGREVAYLRFEYYMLNKPKGVISASRADLRNQGETCVVDLIDAKKRRDLFPVGRLDKDTEGLLLITNDGALAHRLLSPKKHVWKTYYAELSRDITEAEMTRLSTGVEIGDEKPTLPCKVEAAEKRFRCSTEEVRKNGMEGAQKARREQTAETGEDRTAQRPSASHIYITIREGRYHQIKRMVAALGDCEVVYLKRLSMGSLFLDETLETGGYRALTEAEVQAL